VQQRVEAHLPSTTDADTFARLWAHASLRLVDWAIRHHPQHVDHWLAVARRYL
jgi:transposase